MAGPVPAKWPWWLWVELTVIQLQLNTPKGGLCVYISTLSHCIKRGFCYNNVYSYSTFTDVPSLVCYGRQVLDCSLVLKRQHISHDKDHWWNIASLRLDKSMYSPTMRHGLLRVKTSMYLAMIEEVHVDDEATLQWRHRGVMTYKKRQLYCLFGSLFRLSPKKHWGLH